MPYGNRVRTSPEIQQRAKELRQQMTPAERVLWEHLRAKRLKGLKFRRQHPLGPFIVDFCCPEHRLVIEVDGGVHELQKECDEARTEQLEAYGYRVLRFRNEDVLHRLEDVLEAICEACGV